MAVLDSRLSGVGSNADGTRRLLVLTQSRCNHMFFFECAAIAKAAVGAVAADHG